METIFTNTENSEMNESHKFVLNMLQRLDLQTSNKYVALQNLSIYYTWKNIRKQYKDNKQHQHGMMSLNYQMVLILCQISKIISSKSLKSTKH